MKCAIGNSIATFKKGLLKAQGIENELALVTCFRSNAGLTWLLDSYIYVGDNDHVRHLLINSNVNVQFILSSSRKKAVCM